MPLPALATVTDLAAHMQRDLSEADTYTATLALSHASDLIRSFLGETITEVHNDTATVAVEAAGRIGLPQHPVISVESVTVFGTPVSWRADPRGIVINSSYHSFTAEVVYSHGYTAEDIPGDIVGVCLDVAARRMGNPRGVQQETVGAYSYTLARADAGLALTADEQTTLRRSALGRPQLYTVALG